MSRRLKTIAAMLITAISVSLSMPVISFAEETDEEAEIEEVTDAEGLIGITEDGDYLMHGEELFYYLKEVKPWIV